MQSSDIPSKIPTPWANQAGVGYVNPAIPVAPPGTPGRASFDLGFPPDTFQQIAAGGTPPFGDDMNGLMLLVTKWLRWAQAGGLPTAFDGTFSSAVPVGGYPKGAFLRSATLGNGKYWISAVENNTVDPDAGPSANWIPFPQVLVQLQGDNYAVDTGTVNNVVVTLGRIPASNAEIIGTPIRFKIAFTNTTATPVIRINGLPAMTMINSDGSALAVGQCVGGRTVEGFPCDDGKFQVSMPSKPATAPGATWPIPGYIMPWPNETVPTGFLEMNGAVVSIATYPALFGVLGTRYGGDGVNTFALPDWRGEFVRGWDHGRGLDPNAGTRTANHTGGLTGDHVGTLQADAVKPSGLTTSGTVSVDVTDPSTGFHLAEYATTSGLTVGDGPGGLFVGQAVGPLDGTFSGTVAGGGAETRPVNVYAMWVIKF